MMRRTAHHPANGPPPRLLLLLGLMALQAFAFVAHNVDGATTDKGAAADATDAPFISYSLLQSQRNRQQKEQQAAATKTAGSTVVAEGGVQLHSARRIDNLEKVLQYMNHRPAASSSSSSAEDGRQFSYRRPSQQRASQIGKEIMVFVCNGQN